MIKRQTSLRTRDELNKFIANRPDAVVEYEKAQERAEIDLAVLDIAETFSFYGYTHATYAGIPARFGLIVEAGTAEFDYYIRAGMSDIIDDTIDAFTSWYSPDDSDSRDAAAEIAMRLDATEAAINRARKELEAYR